MKLKRATAIVLTMLLLVVVSPIDVSVEVVDFDSDSETVSITYYFSEPKIQGTWLVSDQISNYVSVTMEGLPQYGVAGLPVLPFKTARILLPFGTELQSVKVTEDKKVSLSGSYLVECGQEPVPLSYQGPVEPTPPDETTYNSPHPFPGELYSDVSIQSKMGYRILLVNLHPLQYIPKTRELFYHESITVEVDVEPEGESKLLSCRGLPQDRETVKDIVDNPKVIGTYPISGEPPLCEYVIITNEELLGAPEPDNNFWALMDDKIFRGISATVVTTEEIYADYNGTRPDGGEDNQTKIRNFIIYAYNNWGTRYVLLGGDGDGADVGGESGDAIIPHRGLYGAAGGYVDYDIPADMYYGCLDGTFDSNANGIYGEPDDGPRGGEVDLFAEVYIGRACVDNQTEVQNFVRKTLAYHAADYSPDLRKVWMVGEDLGWVVWGRDYKDEIKRGSVAHDYTTIGFENSPYASQFNVSTLYDRDWPDNNWPKSEIINIINNNTHLLNHVAHTDVGYAMKMTNDDVDSLTNEALYFIGYSQGCYCGSFDNRDAERNYTDYDCISEHLTTQASGAVAFISNSREGWGNPFTTNGASQHYDREFWDAVLGEDIFNIGIANQDSKEDTAGWIGDLYIRWCYYTINLFGDPELSIKIEGIFVDSHEINDIVGDGDGYPEPGEYIEMPVTLRNTHFNTNFTNVTATLSATTMFPEIMFNEDFERIWSGKWILLATDPDEGNGTSLKAIYGQMYSDIIYFKVEHYRSWPTIYDIDTWIFMDADQNASTGLPDGWMFPSQNTGIGADYVIILDAEAMFRWDPINGDLDWDNPISLAYLEAPNGTNVFVVGVYLADIETSGFLDCAILDIPSDEDWMPDTGHFTFFIYLPERVALFKNVDPWGYPANEVALSMHGIPYNVFNSSDFGSVDLSMYSKVVLASDQDEAFYDAVNASSGWFEDYATDGGLLEIHAAGHWIGPLPGGLEWIEYFEDYVSIVDPTHPVVATPNLITDTELDEWGPSVQGFFVTYPVNSCIVIIEDSTGYPAYLTFQYGSGMIIASSLTLEWAYWNGYSLILENDLFYPIRMTLGSWIVGDWNPLEGQDYWGVSDYRAYAGSWSAYCAGVSDVPGQEYDNDTRSFMYRTVDLTGYDIAALSYYYWLDSGWAVDSLMAGYYDSADSSWHWNEVYGGNIKDWMFGYTHVPTTATSVGFLFLSDFMYTYEGAYVDEVTLTAYSLGPDPYINITDNYKEYGNLSAGATATSFYDFEISLDCPEDHVVILNFEITADNGGPWTDSFEVTIASRCNISGQVTDLETGGPIAGATVHYSGPVSGCVTTEPNGNYAITGLVEGTYTKYATALGYSDSDHVEVTLPPDEENNDFELGISDITVTPLKMDAFLLQGETVEKILTIHNNGNFPLTFEANAELSGLLRLGSQGSTAESYHSVDVIEAEWALVVPTLDGVISAGEWDDAEAVDITATGMPNPVTLYAKYNDTHLYIAFVDTNDLSLTYYDQIGIFFDEDHDGQWQSPSSDSEGNFWLGDFGGGGIPSDVIFRSMPDYTEYPNPAGVSGALSDAMGYVVHEAAIELDVSPLDCAPGDTIGLWAYILDYQTESTNGVWPESAIWDDPSTYGDLALSGVGWLSVNPASGTVMLGESMDITVTFNATGLDVGEYEADIVIESNDPDEPTIIIPAKLIVRAIIGDVDGDGTVNASDLLDFSKAYGSYPSKPNWDPACDFNNDDKVDASDLFNLSKNYGKTI